MEIYASVFIVFNCPCLQATERPKPKSVIKRLLLTLVKLHPTHTSYLFHLCQLIFSPLHTNLLPQLLQLSVFSCQSGQHVCNLASCISWQPRRPRGGRWPKTEESAGWSRSLDTSTKTQKTCSIVKNPFIVIQTLDQTGT